MDSICRVDFAIVLTLFILQKILHLEFYPYPTATIKTTWRNKQSFPRQSAQANDLDYNPACYHGQRKVCFLRSTHFRSGVLLSLFMPPLSDILIISPKPPPCHQGWKRTGRNGYSRPCSPIRISWPFPFTFPLMRPAFHCCFCSYFLAQRFHCFV